MSTDHREREFERSIVQSLVDHGGYTEGVPGDFSAETALLAGAAIAFVRSSQPKQWERFASNHPGDAKPHFIKCLCKNLDTHGMLHVLRHGFVDLGVHIDMMFSMPQTSMNPEAMELYGRNVLTVVRQIKHSVKRPNDALDLCFFVNGLPVATAEIKTKFTGQSYRNARTQYRKDRDPADPVFRFKKRALVHFALDTDEVWMTTRLAKEATGFLPFNKGNGDAAGNPVNPDGYKTAYLWEYVLARDSWIDILARFLHLEVKKEHGKVVSETVIFPRYHQLDAVRKLTDDVRRRGAGGNYLIQHSAGSGKSNSIAWLAHRLASIHDSADHKIFNSVVVITDRRVLDKQLQDTIYQFEHKAGVVEPIDKDSGQLAAALKSGAAIIITTLQKFPFVTEKIGELPERAYAVIVDEAHSSQTGESTKEMKAVLASSLDEAEAEALEEEAKSYDYEDEIVRSMSARGRRKNLSFFAFTATPKFRTLEMFGTPDAEGKPRPFHLYSMRQAIEEEFILDVLGNYTTYKTFFRIAKRITDDPELDKKKAASALMRYISGHPHNIAEKTKVMVEHFYHTTRTLLDGKAKAMVVTASRLHAVKYYFAFRSYIKERGYQDDVKVLVAFSGKVKDPDTGAEHSEASLNGFSDNGIPEQFKGVYNILIVAYKFQTGFDQPLLHTMYVDQMLRGVKAVQTLSRLNRIFPGKRGTFVLDFCNEAGDIHDAFEPYYVSSTVDEVTDPNDLYDYKAELDDHQVYWPQEVENFAREFFKPGRKKTGAEQSRMHGYIDPAVERFAQLDKEEQDDFRSKLSGYLKLYSYVSNIMPFSDPALEKLFVFARFLRTKLPKGDREGIVYIDDDVALEYYRLQKIHEGQSMYLSGEDSELPSDVTGASARGMDDEKVRLSELISTINDLFGDFDFGEADKLFFDQIGADLARDETVQAQAKNNTRSNFLLGVRDAVIDAVVDRMEKNDRMSKKFLDDEAFREIILDRLILEQIYRTLQISAPSVR